MQHIYPAVAIILSTLSGLFPFSLYDLFILVASLYLIVLILFLIFRKTSFKKFLYSLIRFVTMLVVWFYFAWGISYFREDFYAKSDLKETTFDAENLKKFVIRFVADANEAYVDFDVMDRAGVRQDLEESYHALHEKLGIDYPNGKRRAKPMLFESLYSKMGVSGYFGPFFNEIHVNNYSLDTTYPFTLAHEMAHQFGIAHESEANLYAFIVCMQSEDERIRYSAYLLTLLYLVNDAAEFLPEEVDSLTSAIRPEIIADLRRNREHWLAVRNRSLSEVQDKAYDAYLKTNKVSSGRENYSEVVGLLISSYDTFIKK
ncbi:MAG: hypothetical protein A2W86_06470 [Bacteroidetes bacterium GWD2_45_23]|nr:MAG: hypothetical protein A2W87_01250 [Bacteroidetes bacterium GWC2_46_850]OFX77700.1 MAG: hypothetical protein A2071_11750 [Bacteroidetes bacterium GWC1_47_7]OFX83050.1 MAG: hypothetical protein A2W86_06470 [Bacteroidetes bacterium GWD2_45_23]